MCPVSSRTGRQRLWPCALRWHGAQSRLLPPRRGDQSNRRTMPLSTSTHSLCSLLSRLLLSGRLQPAQLSPAQGGGGGGLVKAPCGGMAQDAAVHVQDGGVDVSGVPLAASISWKGWRPSPGPCISWIRLLGVTGEGREGHAVRISHYVVSRVYKIHYILSLLRSGTSTISTKFHQALKLQIGF